MKSYAPDNTSSSLVILVSLGVIIAVIAALFGLSDKPEVASIEIIPGSNDLIPAVSTAVDDDETNATDANATDPELFDLATGDDASAGADDEAEASAAIEPTVEREVIPVPTLEPTPTPEVVAAVEPTAVPDADEVTNGTDSAVDPDFALPTSSGAVQGQFFTRSDEAEGAIVNQNLVTISFTEEGEGEFQGVLEISYPDGTEILLNMSGPLTWAPANPQVQTQLSGAFTLDAPIDADDFASDDAELIITSLNAESGSLCTPRCFGFTFTAP